MENKKRIEKYSLIALLVAIISVPLYTVVNIYGKKSDTHSDSAQYVGKESCIECHLNEYNQWEGSDHDKAMEHANDSTVLGDFNDQTLEYQGITSKMYKKGDKFIVYTDGEDGKMQEFEVKYTFGYYPLQQYLVEFDGGRLQTLAITWDSENNKWYHMASEVYPDQKIDHNNWLHWTNQAQNWNSMCADCHSTNLVKGYDVETDTYNTTWSEIDVSCEACHGPASEHLKWASQADYARNENNNYGLTVKTSGIDNKEFIDQCMRCHSRRGAIGDYDHDANIYNHSIPSLPTPENYHIDGQILSEDYVYASFTQSKMYFHDVQCNDCHNVHSTERLFEDNRLCTQCHRADDYDTPLHHFHKGYGESGEAVVADDGVKFEVGEGSKCINCHMPAQYYMGVDYRNDHSMRIPRPDLTKELGTPNACNQCHADKSVDWSIQHINKWYGESKHYQYGEAFHEATTGSQKGFNDLVRIYNDETYPEIIRATAIEMLGQHYQAQAQDILLEALNNSYMHIKYNALNVLQIGQSDKVLDAVASLLNDPTKAVRNSCVNKLMGVDNSRIPSKYQKNHKKALEEYRKTLEYNADFPTGKFNLGNYYYNNGDNNKAEQFYEKALEQDSELHMIKVNLALVYNAEGKFDKSEAMFKDYLKNVPEDGNVTFNYALFLSERKRYDESLKYLEKASSLSPNNARYKYNTAMMFDFFNNKEDAEKYMLGVLELAPNEPSYYLALLGIYNKYQDTNKSKQLARDILSKFPNIQNKEQIQQIAM